MFTIIHIRNILINRFSGSCVQEITVAAVTKAADALPPQPPTRSHTSQPLVNDMFERQRKYDPRSREARDLHEAVTNFFCKDQMPIFTVEKTGFRNLVNKLNPRYQLPSRKHFTEIEIPNLYESTKTKLHAELQSYDFFACTTDIWTSRTMMSYMSVTAQVSLIVVLLSAY